MANRYWVGGSGTWDTTSTTHWSATSGGSGGASVPTSADAVFFDAHSFGTGSPYTITLQSGVTLNCASLTISFSASTPVGTTLTTTGTTLVCATGSFSAIHTSTSAAVNITLGASTISCTNWTVSGSAITLSAASATIQLNASSGTDFKGGSKTYGTLLIANNAVTSTTTVTGNNTIGTLSSTKTVAHSIVFPSGGTTTIGSWGVSGSAGALAAIRSSSTSTKTNLVYSGSGVVSADYLSANDIAASPANTWYVGTHSVDGLDNTGLIFTGPPYVSNSLFFGCNF